MDDMTRFEDRFEERVRAFAKTGVQSADSAAVARAAAADHPKSAAIKPDQRRRLEIRRPRSISRTTFAAAAVVAMLAVGGALFVVAGGPSPTPSADPSPSLPVVVAPSSAPSDSAPSAEPTSSAPARSTGAWIATGTMGTPRSGHTAVRLLDGRVLVVGDSVIESHPSSAELYDPDSGTWSATGTMIKPRDGFPATLLRDGRVLVGDVGGDEEHGAELYDPSSGTWTDTGKKGSGGGGESTATLLRDGRVLVIGYNETGAVYDPASGTWTVTGKMTDPRHSHAAILLPDGKVLVAGGHAPGDDPTDSAELYDPDSGSWTAIANMHAKRDSIDALLQPDGKVLVVGSSRDNPQSVEIYDPATGTWTPTQDVARPDLVHHTATRLLDGTVLLTGGRYGPDDAVTAEVYDPATGSWTAVETLLQSHQNAPATLLLDGTVLVSGGMDCPGADADCFATNASELYVPAGVSAPDLGPLPSPTPIPTPTPSPPPPPVPPAVGPVPQGARTWTVTVDNKSSEPATLFAAEDGETGVGRLCGNVTPNVVPPGTTHEGDLPASPKERDELLDLGEPGSGRGGIVLPDVRCTPGGRVPDR